MEIERKLAAMGLELPAPPTPVANYVGAVQVGDLLFIGGVSNRMNGVLKYRGKVGSNLTVEQAYDAARMCALNHLAAIKAALGDLDRGKHTRLALGAAELNDDIPVETEIIVQVRPG